MNKPRVLMVTGVWPPISKAGVHRPLRLAQRLPDRGWIPTILTPTITRTLYEGTLDLDFDLVSPPEVEVLRPNARMPRWRLLRRMAQLAEMSGQLRNFERVTHRLILPPPFFPEWTKGAIQVVLDAHLQKPFDVVWATGNPWGVFLSARKIARRLNCPLVLDYRDPWTANPDQPNRKGVKHTYQRKLEARCVADARGIAYVHPRCLVENQRVFSQPTGATWRVIFNGYEPMDTEVEKLGTEQPTLVHGGHCYASRSAMPVLNALMKLPITQRPRVRFFGALDAQARKWLSKNPCPEAFETRALIPVDQLRRHLLGAAAQILLIGSDHAHAVPSKLFEYMQTRRPVIGIGPLHSEAKRIVEDCQIGVWLAPDDIDGIANALRKSIEGTLPYAPKLKNIEQFSADQMADDTAALLSEVIK